MDLITAAGPLVAPSANRSGKPSPTKAIHVKDDLGYDFPVIDGGSTQVGLESTVIDLTGSEPSILRPGSISRKQLENVMGVKVDEGFFRKTEKPRSPGQKYSHYKPQAEVRWYAKEDLRDKTTLFLVLDTDIAGNNIISYKGDLNLMAKELYDRFRQADLDHYSTVCIQKPSPNSPSDILSAFINRVERAIG